MDLNKLRTALVLRKIGDKILIVGSTISDLNISEDKDYLFLGELNFKTTHAFNDFEVNGLSPDDLLTNGGLDYKKYKNKLK